MDREVTHKNIKYGMMVEVLHENGQNYHAGCKVHFFNKKGVLVGNYYEFLPYSRLRLRAPYKGKSRNYQRFFLNQRFETIKKTLFVFVLKIVTRLLRFTQKYMD